MHEQISKDYQGSENAQIMAVKDQSKPTAKTNLEKQKQHKENKTINQVVLERRAKDRDGKLEKRNTEELIFE